jgi:transcriptional regulator with XRE-family HTH domain
MTGMPTDPTPVRLRLAENMRRLRQKRDWSQEDLAAKARLHRNQIGAMERGENSVGIDIIDKLARTFEVLIGELLD